MTSNRASLLAGLRTGGVRSVSGPDHDQLSRLNPNSPPFTPSLSQQHNTHLQALQIQMMQLEIMRLQAQQYQAEAIAHQRQQQQHHHHHHHQQQQPQAQSRRANVPFNVPASAGPTSNGSFDLRSASQPRRVNQAELLRAQLGVRSDDQVPMTAALGGKFGSRTVSANIPYMPKFAFDEHEELPPMPLSLPTTTVISGGTPLGALFSNGNTTPATPSKSDSATSWRRGGNNNSVLSGNNRAVTSPRVKITPPPEERVSPPPDQRNTPSPPIATPVKSRPLPLRFSTAAAHMLPAVAIDTSPLDSIEAINSARADDGYSTSSSSSSSSKSASTPTTPRSASSNEYMPLSPREEASKKLYEGLGIGRPAPALIAVADNHTPPPVTVVSHRVVSQPVRQPRGPPSGTDELAPQNFASRLRRKAIGGLGAALMSARERREVVEAY